MLTIFFKHTGRNKGGGKSSDGLSMRRRIIFSKAMDANEEGVASSTAHVYTAVRSCNTLDAVLC